MSLSLLTTYNSTISYVYHKQTVGCPNAYVTGGAYVEGSTVAVGTLVYQCKTGPASGWCPLTGYTPGTGTAWIEAWELKGSCNPAIALGLQVLPTLRRTGIG